PIGTNLDGINYYSPLLPTLDLMKPSDRWIPQYDYVWDSNEPVPVDADGWVTRLPRSGDGLRYTRVFLTLVYDNPAGPPPNTRFVVLYTGTGTFRGGLDTTIVSSQPGRLVIRSGTSRTLALQLVATDPAGTGDYVRNVGVIQEDRLPLYTAGQSFNPDMVAKLAPFSTMRFMNWMNTNEIFDTAGKPITSDAGQRAAPSLLWAHRPRVTSRQWAEGTRGMPVEKMVEFANQTGINPWFNMPINASDDYVKKFATYVRDNLRRDLKVRVELSNEVWNFVFPQSRYAEAQAVAKWGPGATWMEWYGMRTAQVGRTWNQVFREPITGSSDPRRVIVVYNTQFGWRGLETYGLETPRWRDHLGQPVRAADYFDEYAITGYIGGTMDQESQVAAVTNSWRDADGGYARAITNLRNQVTNDLAPGYAYHAGKARQYGLKMTAYESGYAETTPISQHQNQRYTDFLVNVQRRPEMQSIYTANLNAFRDAGGTLFSSFGLIYTPNKWGSWGVLESINQATSPRYSALAAWGAANNPPKTPGVTPATVQASDSE
ncbi:MAG: hypothetical protein ACKVOP_06820, partial [Sphingomonadaceae bacterium]